MKTLITNARIVNEGTIREGNVLIENGRIAAIGPELTADDTTTVHDAQGKTLLPGMIDDQVHFREPGLTHKAEIATESVAAVAGGITSYMEMPNVNPSTTTLDALAAKYEIGRQRSAANYAFYLGATNENIDVVRSLKPSQACGVKAFMGASTGNLLVDSPEALELLFAECPILIATHCEDSPMIGENMLAARAKYGDDIPIEEHPLIRSAEACYKSSAYAVDLATRHGSRLHVLHLTTAKEMEHFTPGPIEGKRITAEACVHHLFFTADDYATRGNMIKCNPAVKAAENKQALLKAVIEDRIDVIATDHAPHLWDEKQGNYMEAPAGLPLVQHALLSVLEHYHNGLFSLELIAKKTAHAVAECYQVKERGYIREGYWADLVLVDLDDTTTATHATALSKCGWTPFDGYQFRSRIDTTWVNGECVYTNGDVNPAIRGQAIEFNHQF